MILVFALVAALAVSGCGTVLNLSGEPHVYGGVRRCAACSIDGLTYGLGVAQPDPKLSRADCLAIGACGLADLPFSVVADTLTLPYVVPRAVARVCEERPTPAEPSAQSSAAQAEDWGP